MEEFMNIDVVVAPESRHKRRIAAALAMISGSQRYYRLALREDSILSITGSDEVNAASLSAEWTRRYGEHVKAVLITEAALDDNWFSHEYRDSAVLSIAEWEEHYAPPSLRAYLMYQLAQAMIHFAADMSEEMALNMVHEPAVGCIYDMAIHKPDIKYGMVAGNVCASCVAKLRALATPQDAIDALASVLEIVRNEALGMPVALNPDEIFVVMRFTSNDENDNAWKYGIKPGGERCGLRVVRADNQVQSGQLLDKIQRHIARSRLVLAKVDEDNLNVFFELGLAMGMKKDVLLISEDALVLKLPSDLRNWECLTYPKGNYEVLAERVASFLATTYGLTA
jgi:hypothetical protein